MDTLKSENFEHVNSLLLHEINSCNLPSGGVQRLEITIPEVDLLDWLAAQRNVSKYYWTNRTRSFEMAGIGEAHILEADSKESISDVFARLRQHIPMHEPLLRYYGGFRFHRKRHDNSRWHDFRGFRFVIPRFEICRRKKEYVLACNIASDSDKKDLCAQASNLIFYDMSKSSDLPCFQKIADLPDQQRWRSLVRKAVQCIGRGDMEKVVLARETAFYMSYSADPIAIMKRLAETAHNVYLFCFHPSPLRAFLGASPERLLKRRGRFILSEALAGTRPRGRTIAEDAQFARELLQNEKENREHRIVVNDICSTFNRYCDRISSGDAPGIRKLAHCQHLHTPISGWLQGDGNDAHLMQSLHPTSAVGGLPKEAAVQWILKNEPFERGIYAAPVGWVGAHASEFCVGIRSGLILDKTLTLYSGAGIVAGADADNEWMELDAKLNGFLMGMRDNCTNECI